MMQKVYTKIESIVGNVVTVRASDVRLGDLALVGESYANVIKLDKDLVTLQVFSGTQGVSTTDSVRFLGRPMMVSFSDHLLGRIFDGAGVTVPVFRDLQFEDIRYEVADYPLWVDTAAVRLREIARLDALAKTLRRQLELLQKELLSTAQRVNLFEKVKIPEAKENIRVIGIYLGDQQTSAVVRGKIAKKKLQEVSR